MWPGVFLNTEPGEIIYQLWTTKPIPELNHELLKEILSIDNMVLSHVKLFDALLYRALVGNYVCKKNRCKLIRDYIRVGVRRKKRQPLPCNCIIVQNGNFL